MQSYKYNLDGEIEPIDETYNGRPFFRKLIDMPIEYLVTSKIYAYPLKHKNIVDFYHIERQLIDIELVNTYYKCSSEIIDKMRNVKDYLQSLNIAYIDWKPDNIGISLDGEPKLFDFNCCGIFGGDNTWVKEPFLGYAYRFYKHIEDPKQIDNACFDKFLVEYLSK